MAIDKGVHKRHEISLPQKLQLWVKKAIPTRPRAVHRDDTFRMLVLLPLVEGPYTNSYLDWRHSEHPTHTSLPVKRKSSAHALLWGEVKAAGKRAKNCKKRQAPMLERCRHIDSGVITCMHAVSPWRRNRRGAKNASAWQIRQLSLLVFINSSTCSLCTASVLSKPWNHSERTTFLRFLTVASWFKERDRLTFCDGAEGRLFCLDCACHLCGSRCCWRRRDKK